MRHFGSQTHVSPILHTLCPPSRSQPKACSFSLKTCLLVSLCHNADSLQILKRPIASDKSESSKSYVSTRSSLVISVSIVDIFRVFMDCRVQLSRIMCLGSFS